MLDHKSSLDKVRVWTFLQNNPIGVLTSLNAENTPETAVMYFFTESDFTCFFITKVLTRKYQNFLKNPHATLFSFDEATLTSVEINGKVETVTSISEVTKIIGQFQELVLKRKSGYWMPPVAQIEAGQYVVCKLVPTRIRFSDFSSESSDKMPELLTFTS